jgi:adenylate kinase
VRLLLLAPPGAGKGTQGERLAAWSGARHIAAGDLLRAEARAGSPLGQEIAACQAGLSALPLTGLRDHEPGRRSLPSGGKRS